jgi:cell division septation protein DedD
MAQTEGEKELVLGNKQLISLFFVGVALCGVFFAMGYMMGRPSGKQLAAIPDTSPAAQAAPIPEQESEPPRETAPPPATADPQPASPATQTQAARDLPAAHAVPVSSVPAPVVPAPVVPETGAPYLQVTALRRADADNLVKTLKEQNFPALLADSSKPDLFRVLVGPYRQTSDVADAKARLKALGFANAFVQK